MQPVAECNLYDFLTKSGGLNDRDRHEVRRFFGCLAGAVHYLHDCKFRHRDLSSRNILIYQGSIYISDFGSAMQWMNNSSHGSVTQDRHVPASIEYMAPEVARKAPRNSSSDMWSLGVVFLEMTTLLVGQTLHQLQTTVERSAKSRNMEPYIWANPRVVNTWVNELQKSNAGPRHDNEPLDWIRELLDETADNRPKSRGLMQNILESPSFNIFCCMKCQPEFRERRFEYSVSQSKLESSLGDSADLRDSIASILQEDIPQPVTLSSKKSSSITTWLAGTEAKPSAYDLPTIPGSFAFGNANNVGLSKSSPSSQSLYASAREHTYLSDTEMGPPPPPLPALDLIENSQSSPHIIETVDLLENTQFHYDAPKSDTRAGLHITSRPKCGNDTGLGFLEYDSSSSSDEDQINMFNELEDSSGSDSDSDATVLLPNGHESEVNQRTGQAAAAIAWPLPNFIGEENNWIQTLDMLSEDLEDGNKPSNLAPEEEFAINFQEMSDESDDAADEAVQIHDVVDKALGGSQRDMSPEIYELRGSRRPSMIGSDNCVKTTESPCTMGNTYGSPYVEDSDEEPEAQHISNTSMENTWPELSDQLADVGTVIIAPVGDPNRVQAPALEDVDLLAWTTVDHDFGKRKQLLIGLQSTAAESMQAHEPFSHSKSTSSQQSRESTQNKALIKGPNLRRNNMVPFGEIIKSSVSQKTTPTLIQTVPQEASTIRRTSKPYTFVPELLVNPDNTLEENARMNSPTHNMRNSSRTDPLVPKPPAKPSVKVRVPSPTGSRIKPPKPTTNFQGRRRDHPTAPVASLKDSLTEPKRFQRKKHSQLPGINASEYIEETWESASSVATSAMSENTSRILKNLSLKKWLDRDHGILETFCAKGNVEAVRILLSKGCNPGRIVGYGQGRRIGPLVQAIKGSSLKHNKCVKELIQYSVDVNAISRKSGKSPLHLAIENPYFNGYEHLIRDLIEAGADTNKADQMDDRPIMKVFYGNDIGPLEDHRCRALALLLREAATKVDFILPGTLNTPLHMAVRRKDPFAVGMLLHKKANINAKNASGTTPLLLTANQFQAPMANDHVVLLKLLLESEGIAIDEKAGVNEQTALHYAVRAGVSTAVELLITHGASPHCKDSEGRDALALAIQHTGDHIPEEHAEIMLQLRDSMAKTWPKEDDKCILELACKSPAIDLMQGLLENGLDTKLVKNSRPILHRSIVYKNQAVVEFLAKNGANVDAKDEKGLNAAEYAVQIGANQIARYLVKEGRYHNESSRVTLETLEELIAAKKDLER